jgi:transposase-like protein
MAKLTRLIQKTDSTVEVVCPVTDSELKKREADYPSLPFIDFAKRHRDGLYKGVTIIVDGKPHDIQANFCINPFCRWYGLPQQVYPNLSNKPQRYALSGSHPTHSIKCLDVPVNDPEGITFDNDYTSPMSNWSLALEIKRLIDLNTLKPMEEEYEFHREDCSDSATNPFDNPTSFAKRGKSTSNSQKYRCKTCGKMTNVLPTVRECFTYNQKKNNILPTLMLQMVNRTPITRTLEQLKIGSSTYYNKLEWLHRRCLEFLERHETQEFESKHFNKLWLHTDKFVYNLNNIRKKGYGTDYIDLERPRLMTHMIATTDAYSRYVFRTDLAYDCDVKPEDIEKDIEVYKEDKLNTFVQKNARYRYSYYTNRKNKEDLVEDVGDDVMDRSYLQLRKEYVDGLHVNSTYTAYAQYWLLKRMLNVDKLNFVCDDDLTLVNSIMRVFKDEIKEGKMNLFSCRLTKNFSKEEAKKEFYRQKNELDYYINGHGKKGTRRESAIDMLVDDLRTHKLFSYVLHNGVEYPVLNRKDAILHPMPFIDEGTRLVRVLTNLSELSDEALARELINVNLVSINTYFNQVRRRISPLERPIVTSRNEGKSYIYANFNPKYAHYLLTLMRTYYNFCLPFTLNGKDITPAMALGIADRVYTVEDIIYFR